MNYFIDTEFIEDGRTIELLSLAVVCEDGRELYVENGAADFKKASEWVKQNVLPHLHMYNLCPDDGHECPMLIDTAEIRNALEMFVTKETRTVFWGYYSDYDWVALCQLFGAMVHLPSHFPKVCYDLRQVLEMCGYGHVKQPDDARHHALEDARWIRDTYNIIKDEVCR